MAKIEKNCLEWALKQINFLVSPAMNKKWKWNNLETNRNSGTQKNMSTKEEEEEEKSPQNRTLTATRRRTQSPLPQIRAWWPWYRGGATPPRPGGGWTPARRPLPGRRSRRGESSGGFDSARPMRRMEGVVKVFHFLFFLRVFFKCSDTHGVYKTYGFPMDYVCM